MKALIEFNLDNYEDMKAHKRCINATGTYCVLNEIVNEIFRPARKYGYHERSISALVHSINSKAGNGAAEELVRLLEEKFYLLLDENNISLEDL